MASSGQVVRRRVEPARNADAARRPGFRPSLAASAGDRLKPARDPAASDVGACCLIGFWGVPNFGDEWLFRAAQGFLREAFPSCRLSALVGSALLERRLGQHHDGVALLDGFFPNPSFFARLPAIVRAIKTADMTLIGGGGLINDGYTPFSIPRYAVPALLAIALGRPVVWWGLGVVPPRRRLLRHLALWTLRHAAAVLVRDRGSHAYLQANGVAATLSEDLSVLGPASQGDARPRPAHRAERLLVVNFRDQVPALRPGRLRFVEAQLDRFDRVVLVAAEPCDEPVYRGFVDELTLRRPMARVEVVPADAYARIQDTLAGASHVVSERLHISLFALAAGVPTTVISYERKIDEVVGRLYPSARITPRELFWRDPTATCAPATVTPGPDIDVPACKRRLAAQLRLASRRTGVVRTRAAAIAWLAVLLPAGAALAAVIWLKRLAARSRTTARADGGAAAAVLILPRRLNS